MDSYIQDFPKKPQAPYPVTCAYSMIHYSLWTASYMY